nr:MATE family efflux transporter [uncultured Celeribacter sp.]
MSPGPASTAVENRFLTRPVGRLFLSNALPMAVVMSTGGLLNVIDGIFVGRFVGAQALAAVSLAFPIVMLLTALTTLAGGGMSSLLARHLGAGSRRAAGEIFAGGHGLALTLSVVLFVASLIIGPGILSALAAGDAALAGSAQSYLLILIIGAPIQFGLGLHADALRNEGRAGQIALLSVLVNLLNVGANFITIVILGMGVAGSALGTVGAQALGLLLVLAIRLRDRELLPLSALWQASWLTGWRQMLSLGLPLCLSFIGMALVAGTVVRILGTSATENATYIAAYGVVTRVLGLAFLPQMAIALTTQSITGNNAGAGRVDRASTALRLAMASAFLWCLGVALVGTFAGAPLGALFTRDRAVIASVAAILRPMTALYAITGPILVLALHFQAMGYPLRTAALTLTKPWLLTPALLVIMNAVAGTGGLWLAFPISDAVLLVVALLMIFRKTLIASAPATTAVKEAT